MKETYTDITVILDRSGSMASIASDMMGGFNQFIANQRKLPGECKVSLTQFDSESIDAVYVATDILSVPHLNLVPRGLTPLLDAVGRTVAKTGERLASMKEDQRPGRVLVLVITDGLENHSSEWTKEKVKKLVEQQQKNYNWAFVFLGANIDSFAEASSMGFQQANVANYAATPTGVAGSFAVMDSAVESYRSSPPAAAAAALAFTPEQRKKMKTDKEEDKK